MHAEQSVGHRRGGSRPEGAEGTVPALAGLPADRGQGAVADRADRRAVGRPVLLLKIAMESKHTPTVILLTRQNVKNYNDTNVLGVSKGAYIVSKESNQFDGILLASGSEIELAMSAKEILKNKGVDVRVVSMPSHHLFEKQTKKYQKEILPKSKKTLAIEMGSSMSWYKYTKDVYGLDTFGASGPMEEILNYFNFTVDKIVEAFLKI